MTSPENVLKALREKKQQNINSFKAKKVSENKAAVKAIIYYALLAIVFGTFKLYMEHILYKISKSHFPSFPLSPSLVLSYTSLFNALATIICAALLMSAAKKEKTKQTVMAFILGVFCFIGMF